MRPKSHALFNLIKKMTPNEKRYFKRLGLSNNEDNQYIILFNAINHQKKYDEASLLEQFKEHSFTNNFSEIKKYLYQQIKKSLRLYHAQNSINITLNNALSDLEILYDKELYEDCIRLIKKTKKLALKYERNSILLSLNDWKRKLVKISHHSNLMIDYLENEVKQNKEYIQIIQNESEYYDYGLKILLSIRRNGHYIEENLPEKILNAAPESFVEKRQYLGLLSILSLAKNDLAAFFKNSIKEVELMDENPHFIKENPKLYIITLSNAIYACQKSNQIEAFEFHFHKKMAALDKYSFDLNFKLRETVFNYANRLMAEIQQAKKERLIKAISDLLKYSQQAEKKELMENSLKLLISSFLALAYLALEDFEKALDHSYLIDSLNIKNHQEVLFWNMRLIKIVLHFHFENWMLLESLTRSALGALKVKFKFDDSAKALIDSIKKCAQIKNSPSPDKQQIKNILSEYLQKYGHSDSITFDFRYVIYAWIKSIIEDKTVLECIPHIQQLGTQD